MVSVDKENCIGCGLCAALAPEVFDMGEDGKAIVKDASACEKNMDACKEAEEKCPGKAIKI